MHQNTFLTPLLTVKKIFFEEMFLVSGNVRKCMQTHFKHSRRSKISFLTKKFLVVWKYAQMHQNTFLTPLLTVKKIFFEEMFLVSGNVRKCMQTHFKHSRR
jgi:hypothetical protein